MLKKVQHLLRVVTLGNHIQQVQLGQPEEIGRGFLLDLLFLQANRAQQKLQAQGKSGQLFNFELIDIHQATEHEDLAQVLLVTTQQLFVDRAEHADLRTRRRIIH